MNGNDNSNSNCCFQLVIDIDKEAAQGGVFPAAGPTIEHFESTDHAQGYVDALFVYDLISPSEHERLSAEIDRIHQDQQQAAPQSNGQHGLHDHHEKRAEAETGA